MSFAINKRGQILIPGEEKNAQELKWWKCLFGCKYCKYSEKQTRRVFLHR